MVEGRKEWTGNSEDIIYSKNEKLNQFIFASGFLQDAKNMRMMQASGDINDADIEKAKQENNEHADNKPADK